MSFKIINFSVTKKLINIIYILVPALLSLLTHLFNSYAIQFTYFIPLFLLWIIIGNITLQPQISFLSTSIAFGLSYCFYGLSSFIATFILYPLHSTPLGFPYELLAIVAVVIESILVTALFKVKRFKKGMPFLFTTSSINITTALCFLLIGLVVLIELNISQFFVQVIAFIIFLSILAFLIHWWQAQITKSYNHSIMLRNIESLTGELEEAYKEIASLKAQNEELGRLIHHDNKRIPAMENAVCEYLVSDFSDVEATKNRGNTLCLEIQSLSRNRSDTLKEIYEKKSRHYSTGISSLDTLLNYMDKRATGDNIQFIVHNPLELETYIPKQISTEDLTHVLSDLLENAIIASKGTTNPAIQLQFYVSEKHFVIEVADSGIPFEAKSILNFGLSRLTTHEATGGSGIGLMDIWSIKEKYGATLHIEEYDTPSPFSKKISLVFNRKNLYSVKTWRTEEINTLLKRNDLRVYSYND